LEDRERMGECSSFEGIGIPKHDLEFQFPNQSTLRMRHEAKSHENKNSNVGITISFVTPEKNCKLMEDDEQTPQD
jgi:hypothetical protein